MKSSGADAVARARCRAPVADRRDRDLFADLAFDDAALSIPQERLTSGALARRPEEVTGGKCCRFTVTHKIRRATRKHAREGRQNRALNGCRAT